MFNSKFVGKCLYGVSILVLAFQIVHVTDFGYLFKTIKIPESRWKFHEYHETYMFSKLFEYYQFAINSGWGYP